MSNFNHSAPPKSTLFQRAKVLKVYLKVFQHYFGLFSDFFCEIEDPRFLRKGNYPFASLLFTGVWLFICRIQAVRQIKFQLHSEDARKTFFSLFQIDSIPHGDTVKNTFTMLDPDQVGALVPKCSRIMVRKRVFEYARFMGFYTIAVDGTGIYVFRKRHCEHCLTKEHHGRTLYYHMVLEAKLITPDGFALSVMSEFIENPGEKPKKQDCETKAFHRLAEKLKQAFPRLPILLLLDGMFAEGPVFQRCRKYNWQYLISLKDGDLPTVNQEFRNLQSLNPDNTKTIRRDGLVKKLVWINEISYLDTQKRQFSLNVFELLETDGAKQTTFRWISSLKISETNVNGLAKCARRRWTIENQGFNTQKNLGFALEHPYSKDPVAMKVFYYLLQIAHIWTQLSEKSSLLKCVVPERFGALKNVAMRLLEDWRVTPILPDEWMALLDQKIRLQFDTS